MLRAWRDRSKKYSTVNQNQDASYYAQVAPQQTLLRPGWKATVSLGAWVLSACLIANITVLTWGYVRHSGATADHKLTTGLNFYKGDCQRASIISLMSHLAINILSTLILGTGTACMQILGSPTREEVDVAHRKGKWFNIGLLSSRNLLGVSRKRLILYCILGATSLPLHFFYNSIIYSTLSVNDQLTIVTTNKFVTEPAINTTRLNNIVDQRKSNYPASNYGKTAGYNLWTDVQTIHLPDYPSNQQFVDAVNALKPSPDNVLTNLTWPDCIKRFGKAPYKSLQNVALVTSNPNVQDDILDILLTLTPGQVDWSCNLKNATFRSTNDLLGKCAQDQNRTLPALGQGLGAASEEMWHVDYCLVKEATGQCEITFYPALMVVVIAVNVVKLIAVLVTLFSLNFRPLVTAGDAVASFMQFPDPSTEGVGAHSTQSVVHSNRLEIFRKRLPKSWFQSASDDSERRNTEESRGSKRRDKKKDRLVREHEKLMHNSIWHQRPQRWLIAVSRARWLVTIVPWAVLTGLIIYYAANTEPTIKSTEGNQIKTDDQKPIDQSFNDLNPGFISKGSADNPLLQQVVLSNLPQVLISLVWVLLTACVTSMLIASEMADFAKEPKGMRVSPPRAGAQRCTYFLQIPYRYYVPMTLAVIVLHWLASEALFLLRLAQYDITNQLVTPTLVSALAYSVKAIAIAAGVSGLMTLSPLFLGLRKFPRGIPILGYNSLALSVACHPPPGEPPETWARPLQYGLFHAPDADGVPRPRVGFTSGPVTRIAEGTHYEATKCLSAVLSPRETNAACTLDNKWGIVMERELTTYESYANLKS